MKPPQYKPSDRHNGEPPYKAAEPDDGLLEELTRPDSPWRGIETAYQDGRPIMVKAALDAVGPGEPAIWHRTRRHQNHRWEPVAFWANPVTKTPLTFAPAVWRAPGALEGLVR